jgi:Domain of unknown function (DUF5655)
VGCQDEPQIRVFVGGLSVIGRHRYHDDVPQRPVGPGFEVREAGLLPTLAHRHREWITLTRIRMAAHLQPRLLSLVPTEQHPPARRMDDERRRGHVQRGAPIPRRTGRYEPADSANVAGLRDRGLVRPQLLSERSVRVRRCHHLNCLAHRAYARRVTWTCPQCGRRFAREDQFHSHETAAVDAHFAGRPPQLRAAFDRLIASLPGDVEIQPLRTVIILSAPTTFSFVTVQSKRLLVGIFIDRPIDAPRVVKFDEVSPSKFASVMAVRDSDDVDDELRGWLREAYERRADAPAQG